MPSRFRTSHTQRAGHEPAKFVQGKVLNVNLVTWTVDILSQFDRHTYFDIQVASPYLHFNSGEGIYVVPEVGAVCMVCLPSDSSPPYVAHFLMPFESIDTSAPDAPNGTRSRGSAQPSGGDASFAGGRLRLQPGDIVLRGRDGNSIILHRGGVLSIGANELAQRIYIPLNNQVVDVSENYAHHNTGGSVTWGLQDGPSQSHFPAQHMQTVRVFADDKYADIRISSGRIYDPLSEPDGNTEAREAGIVGGDDNPIIYEIAVSPKGFVAQSGAVANAGTVAGSVYKFTFDRQGNTYTRCEGNWVHLAKKNYTLKVSNTYAIECDVGTITAKNGLTLNGGTDTNINGTKVQVNNGDAPVARMGDPISWSGGPLYATITLGAPGAVGPAAMGAPLPAQVVFGPPPGGVPTPVPVIGFISGGSPNFLA